MKRFALMLFLLASSLACAQAPPALQPKSKPGDVHLALGNPSNAVHDPRNPDPTNYLIVRDQYALSYNSKRGTPNWVSYRLRKSDMGRAERSVLFFPDDDLPKQFYHVKPFDYHFNRTGMTRGHMCPSSHRNNTENNAKATFIMTNMVPQTEELNGGTWNNLEMWCRDYCFKNNKELHIICGPHGIGGKSERGTFKHTDYEMRVVVPKSCWKVIAILDPPGADGPVPKFNKNTRVIGVLMPNTTEPVKEVPWSNYVVSVENIEQLVGLRFFGNVPAEIIDPLKKKVDSASTGK